VFASLKLLCSTWLGVARHGPAWFDVARRGPTLPDMAWFRFWFRFWFGFGFGVGVSSGLGFGFGFRFGFGAGFDVGLSFGLVFGFALVFGVSPDLGLGSAAGCPRMPGPRARCAQGPPRNLARSGKSTGTRWRKVKSGAHGAREVEGFISSNQTQ
jgi:hypothetical protein